MAPININFDVEIHIEKRDQHVYSATIMPFHVNGYSPTPEQAIVRAKEGLDILLEAYEAEGNLQEFLDTEGIQYTLTGEPVTETTGVKLVKERIAYAGSR